MTGKTKLTARDLELVRNQQVRNVLAKVAAGKTPTAREQKILDAAAVVETKGAARPKGRKGSEEDSVWLTPAEFLRWMPSQGITLSRKNFYRTYFGSAARHPVHVNPEGKLIHKWKAVELIRLIQSRDDTEGSRAIRERQTAEALAKTAEAMRRVIDLEERMKKRIRIDTVTKLWGQAVENLKNELRTIEHNATEDVVRILRELLTLSDEHAGELRARVRKMLHHAHHGALKHMAISYGESPTGNAPANAGATAGAV